ncbi:MAG TPA: precorrin-3B C(17)-methyltransferase [Oscillospiraceae bacterium]|nr:precorrin-3B C(17)-methyltransferase [Oscillospiraceae bacterium]
MVGLGPGNEALLTPQAAKALQEANVVVGYSTYIRLIQPLLTEQTVLSSGMKKEIDRAKAAVSTALQGKHVVVISSGDPGVYGMAGLVLEVAPATLPVTVVPGVTAATSAAAVLGAPLVHDFAVISLSDLLTPWQTIQTRLAAAASADFVIVLYNPRSRGRQEHLRQAQEIMLTYRSGSTPVGFVKNIGRSGESSVISTLAELSVEQVDMTTTVIVGNSQTKVVHGKMVTPRGYTV